VKAHRAITPIIAVLIIIVVTVAIGVLFYLWLTGFMSVMMGSAGSFGSLRYASNPKTFTSVGVIGVGVSADGGPVKLSNISYAESPRGDTVTLTLSGVLDHLPTQDEMQSWSIGTFYVYAPAGNIAFEDGYLKITPTDTVMIYMKVDHSLNRGDTWVIRIGIFEGGSPEELLVIVS